MFMRVVVQESRESKEQGRFFRSRVGSAASLPLGCRVLQSGIVRQQPAIAIRSFARGTLPPNAVVLGYAWQCVASKVHGPIATWSRQSISRMHMCMQREGS
jgi:hypothetical protein